MCLDNIPWDQPKIGDWILLFEFTHNNGNGHGKSKSVNSKVNKECAIKSLSAAKDGSFPSEWRAEFELAGPQALVGRLGRGQDVVRQVASETFPPPLLPCCTMATWWWLTTLLVGLLVHRTYNVGVGIALYGGFLIQEKLCDVVRRF